MGNTQMIQRPIGRRITPQRTQFRRRAESAEIGTVTRAQVAVLAQNLPCTGLINGTESHLLVTLINTTPAESFEKSGRPIVFKSNQQLAFEIGRSIGCVSRTLSKLCDGGLLTMQDSGNYKRYPIRNGDGEITDACGIDLRILIARYAELNEFVRQARAEKKAAEAARRRFRGALRNARYALSAAEGLSEEIFETYRRPDRAIELHCRYRRKGIEPRATPGNGSSGAVDRAADEAPAPIDGSARNARYDMPACRKRHAQTDYKPSSI